MWGSAAGPPHHMSESSNTPKIIALVSITLVVVATLVAVSLRGENTTEATTEVIADAETTPTAVPVLHRPRQTWPEITGQLRGSAGTKAPVACPFIDERELEANNFLSLTPGLTFVCSMRGAQATAIAPGRVVMAVTQPPLNSEKAAIVANGKDGPWIRAAAYGSFVAVDHGPLNGVANVTTIYAGLESVDPAIKVGTPVDTTTPLGLLGARTINQELVPAALTFEYLTDDTRFGGDPLRESPPPASAAGPQAEILAPLMSLPLTTCNMPFGNRELNVGAPRVYRSGTHNGLDFNCVSPDHEVVAAADGEVLFVVGDYLDPQVEDRDAILANAAEAIDTPFWTLAMLYGRFVVVAHHLDGVDDRVVTIYAHLSDVYDDPAHDNHIAIGRQLKAGDPIGLVGNTGTSAAAGGIDDYYTGIHLHWELHVNDRPVGYLQSPENTEPLYMQMLCNADSDC